MIRISTEDNENNTANVENANNILYLNFIPIKRNINDKIRNIISIIILNYHQLFFEHNPK